MSILQKIRKMQIKTTARYNLAPVKMAIVRNSANRKGWYIPSLMLEL